MSPFFPALAYYPEEAVLVPWSWQRSPADTIYRKMKLWDVLDKRRGGESSLSYLLLLKEYSSSQKDAQGRQEALYRLARWYETDKCDVEALSLYWRLLHEFPEAESVPLWVDAIVTLYFHQGNAHAIFELYNNLPSSKKSLLSDHTIYLVGQNYYLKTNYDEAYSLLSRIKENSAFYPFAAFTRAQILYTLKDHQKALDLLGSLLKSGSKIPSVQFLKDLAILTRARILYQEQRFQEAIEEYSRIGQSRVLLPDSLMGIGWAYEALEQYPKALAYMMAVEKVGVDAQTLATTYLEVAKLFSKTRDYEDAFRFYQTIQKSLHTQIGELATCRQDAACRGAMAKDIADIASHDETPIPPGTRPEPSTSAGLASQEEVRGALQRAVFLSDRFKGLSDLLSSLRVVQSQLKEIASSPDKTAIHETLDPFDEEKENPSKTQTVAHLLDAALSLFDLEARTESTGRALGLLEREKVRSEKKETLLFYRKVMWKIILDDISIEGLTRQLDDAQSMIRRVPLGLEDRKIYLQRFLSLKRILLQLKDEVQDNGHTMEVSLSAPEDHMRGLLLDEITMYGRDLFLLREFAQQPTLFLMPVEPMLLGSKERDTVKQAVLELKGRSGVIRHRIEELMAEEIREVLNQEEEALHRLVAETEYFYAEALTRKNHEAVKSIQQESEQ